MKVERKQSSDVDITPMILLQVRWYYHRWLWRPVGWRYDKIKQFLPETEKITGLYLIKTWKCSIFFKRSSLQMQHNTRSNTHFSHVMQSITF